LIGIAVVTTEGKPVGSVVRLLQTGSADLLVVESDDKRELLIPFVDEICTEVDVDARRITINPPAGLLEL
jgi:16S rRNA processing protein RimM